MKDTSVELKHVENLWRDDVATHLDPVERLVYRSNLLGESWRITNTGGGNTSSKLTETDPLSGQPVEVLWVKGSGGDLRTAKRENFSSLYQDKLIALQDVYERFDNRGPKTPAEDAMVGMYAHCTFNLNSRAPSIDTPLHSFVPFKFVDHTHPAACIAIATAANGPELTKQVYGDDVIWTDWLRPGFELGLELQRICKEHPNAKGVILGKHGLINWANDDKECYLLSLDLIDRAEEFLAQGIAKTNVFGGQRYESLPEAEARDLLDEILPWLRGRVSRNKRFIGTVQMHEDVLEFVNSNDAPRLAELGTSCPDHFLRTKIKPLFVDWNPQTEDRDALRSKLDAGIAKYKEDYAAYYTDCRRSTSPDMRVSDPTVILIPGVGMVAWGKSKSESRVTAEFYTAAVAVMKGAEAVSSYTALPRQEAFDIEYWLLEEAKLKRMPPEKELARQVVAVIGAGSGIGKEVTERLIREGAVVAAMDFNETAVKATAGEILESVGMGIGVAGTGLSGSGDIIGLKADVSSRESINAAIKDAVFAYGGIDHVVVTAGLYVSPDAEGQIPDLKWADTFGINVTGPFIVASEAERVWKAQELSGSMVVTTSVNGVVPKKGSIAYDTSKAAANHLVRELAVTLAPHVRVNAVAPASVVAGSSMFPRERVIASLAKYNLPHDESDDTETLRNRLAEFYAARTLTKLPVTPADQSEVIFLLLTKRMSKTTGQTINVDGGLLEAFVR